MTSSRYIKFLLTLTILLLSNGAFARYRGYHSRGVGHYSGHPADLRPGHVYIFIGAIIGVFLLVELLMYLDRRSKRPGR